MCTTLRAHHGEPNASIRYGYNGYFDVFVLHILLLISEIGNNTSFMTSLCMGQQTQNITKNMSITYKKKGIGCRIAGLA